MNEVQRLRRERDLLIGYKKISLSLARQNQKLKKDNFILQSENDRLKDLKLLEMNEIVLKTYRKVQVLLMMKINEKHELRYEDIKRCFKKAEEVCNYEKIHDNRCK
jgi:hypothetical protein